RFTIGLLSLHFWILTADHLSAILPIRKSGCRYSAFGSPLSDSAFFNEAPVTLNPVAAELGLSRG
ncbi:MAG: hypothetical protein NTV34_06985, partial [Proteobacteria bacterium]|nr:hypothetical protein [Pseudomonadota bacterium]